MRLAGALKRCLECITQRPLDLSRPLEGKLENVQIILTGRTLPGCDKTRVIEALAVLLKTTAERTAPMLTGRETIIRRELPIDQAPRYIATVAATGAEVIARPVPLPEESAFPTIELAETAMAETATASAPAASWSSPAPAQPEPPRSPPATLSATGLASLMLEETVEEIACPVCSTKQAKRTLCRNCGANMPQMLAAQANKAEAAQNAREIYSASRTSVQSFAAQHDAAPSMFSFSSSGRLSRSRYMAYLLAYVVIAAAAGGLLAITALAGRSPAAIGVIFVLLLPLWIIMIRTQVLRLHDLNRSGWWWLINLLPNVLIKAQLLKLAVVLSLVMTVVLLFVPGSKESNDYGLPNEPASGGIKLGAIVFCLFSALGLVGMVAAGGMAGYAKTHQHAQTQDGEPQSQGGAQ